MADHRSHPPLWRRTPFRVEEWFDAETLAEARRYARPLQRVRLVDSILTFAVFVAFVLTGTLAEILDGLDVGSWVLELIVGVAVVQLLLTVLGLPLGAWVALSYDKRWGLSNQTPGRFAVDQVKGLVIQTIVTALLLVPLYAAVRAVDLWWLYGWLIFLAFSVVMVTVYPVFVMPRFNRFEPLEDGPLRQAIERVAARAETTIEGVYTMDASKRTRRGNAFVAGLGPTKRVVLFDTILDYPIPEIEQVVAHEIGHYRLHHLWKALPARSLVFLAALLAVDAITSSRWLLERAGVDDLGDPASVGLFLLALALAFMALNLVSAWLSRAQEREADLEALVLLSDPQTFIDLWRRLAPDNKAELEPSWWTRANHSHPEVAERMSFGRLWAEQQGVPLPR